ncbi:MAG: DUF4394 domain-containing protein [Fimbriimonadaceae bacterium]|nr:DUF4394 domain-containing protein [Fimbriimonadaceae bacterium]
MKANQLTTVAAIAAALALITGCGGGGGSTPAGTFLYALTEAGDVLLVPASNPAAATYAFTTKLGSTPTPLSAIDYHSATNSLYGCVHDGTSMKWYRVNTSNGQLLAVTSGSFGSTGQWGLSYDPSTQLFAIQKGSSNDNQVVGTATGTLVAKSALTGAASGIAEIAHTNQMPGAMTPCSAYGIDTAVKQLVQLGAPNSNGPADAGTGSIIGPLGIAATLDPVAGFDIDGQTNDAYAALADPQPKLYKVSLVTGTATPVGVIGGTSPTNRVIGLCVKE